MTHLPTKRLGRNLSVGLAGGAITGLCIVAVEVLLLCLWWGDMPIAPRTLTRTQMFDGLSETAIFIWQWLCPEQRPPGVDRVYASGWYGSWDLARDLALGVLPVAMIVGAAVGMLHAIRGSALRLAEAASWVIGVAAVTDGALWFAAMSSLEGTFTAERGHPLLLVLLGTSLVDGEWVSALTLLVCAAALPFCLRHLPVATGVALRPRPLAVLVAGMAAGVTLGIGLTAAPPRAAVPVSPPLAATSPSSPQRRPNILLISIDSLRADHLGCYGWRRDTSPRIDALAASGVRFTNAWATTSWTLPSHVSMLTGRSLLGHGVLENGDAIPGSVPLLAALLQAAGYRTAAFVAAPYLSSRYGFGRGFDVYDDTTVSFAAHGDSHLGVTSPLIHAAVTRWLEAAADEPGTKTGPFFLFVHFWDVHYDYAPPPPFDTLFDPHYGGALTAEDFERNARINPRMEERDLEHIVALYDGEIRFTDGYVGRLLDLVTQLGLAADTLIIVTADHGDEFFEHGNKGHHRTLYEEVLHVPLIIARPGTMATGIVRTDPVSLTDIVPTVLGEAGVTLPAGIEGRTLFGPPGAHSGRVLVAELYKKPALNLQVAVRVGPHKLVQSLQHPKVEFFDLARDPQELRSDVTRPERAVLSGRLAQWLGGRWRAHSARAARHGHAQAMLSPDHIEALRALGYVE
jgi:arylsulfatase A-like enzyme